MSGHEEDTPTGSLAGLEGDERGRRVLAVTLRYPPYVAGGYELLTRDLVEALRERGHEVTVLSGRGERFSEVPDLLPWLEPGLDGEIDPLERAQAAGNLERVRLHFYRHANFRATRRALTRTDAEVLVYFNLGLVSLAPIVAARCSGVPTLGYAADLWPRNHWVRDWRANPDRAQAKRLQLGALTAAWRGFRNLAGLGRLLVPSEFVARELTEDGVDRESLRVVPLGLSPRMETLAAACAPRPREDGQPLRVLCCSMLWEGKGQHTLLEAAARAVRSGADLELVLAGRGDDDYERRLRELARGTDLAERVRFPGMLDPDALSAELSAAHVLAQPGSWGEPFGLVTLEGMAHGLCPLVTDAGASPELVRDGREGRVVPSNDVAALAGALVELASDDGRRLELAGVARRAVAERYRHAGFVERIEAELEEVAGRRAP